MYISNSKQIDFENFILPFGGKLDPNNRWVKLAEITPWGKIEEHYIKLFGKNKTGNPAKSSRLAFAAIFVKEFCGLSDRETVDMIKENPFIQFFCGFEGFTSEQPFTPSLMVTFRKRFEKAGLNEIQKEIIDSIDNLSSKKKAKTDPNNHQPKEKSSNSISNDQSSSQSLEKAQSENEVEESQEPVLPEGSIENKGKMIIDATCTPADITYPTDTKLLNKAITICKRIITALCKANPRKFYFPKINFKDANIKYLEVAKQNKPKKESIRHLIALQLGYLKESLTFINKIASKYGLNGIKNHQYKNLLVIHEVYRQQLEMWEKQINRIDDRIVNIAQPHIRPIKRGKAGSATEFGAKVTASIIDGWSYCEKISWDNYNEASDLISHIENFRQIKGCYPAVIYADQIYSTKQNRLYCDSKNIRLAAKKLGKPKKEDNLQSGNIKNQMQHNGDIPKNRNPIEGIFGQGKRRFTIGRVKQKLQNTSKTTIQFNFIIMNLVKALGQQPPLFFYPKSHPFYHKIYSFTSKKY